MPMSVISVRVDNKVKEVLKRAGINISTEVKQFLEDLAWRAELKARLDSLNKSLNRLPPAEPGFASKSVREGRERP